MSEATAPQELPKGLMDALTSSSSRRTRPSRTLASFPEGGVIHVTDNEDANKYDLLCPRAECGSIILKAGVGKWVERTSVTIDSLEHGSHSDLPALLSPPVTEQWWLITPSPMAFENIGFSKPVGILLSPETNQPLKLLACAECDLGPLGWCEQRGQEFWLACRRVRYLTD